MFSFIVFVCISIQKSWLADRHYGISTFHTLLHLSDRMLDEAALFFFLFFLRRSFSDPKQSMGSIWHLKVLSCVKGYHEEKRQLKGLKKARQGDRNEGKTKRGKRNKEIKEC